MNIDSFMDSLEPVEDFDKSTAEALRAVLTNTGVTALLGVIKAEVIGKMNQLTVAAFGDIGAVAKLQGEIAGLRRVFAAVDEALNLARKNENA